MSRDAAPGSAANAVALAAGGPVGRGGANGAAHAGGGPAGGGGGGGPPLEPHGDLTRVRAVIFDVDGVLLDARPSFHAVAEESARRAVAVGLGEEAARAIPFNRALEVPVFKAAGGFNDDWDMSRAIACVLLLRARLGATAPPLAALLDEAAGRGVEGLWAARGAAATGGLGPEARTALEPAWITRACGALYAGVRECPRVYGFEAREVLPDAPERGFWELEQPLCEGRVLAEVAGRWALSLFTGRYPAEAELALRLCRLEIPERIRWTADGRRPRKPDPSGLIWLCNDLLQPGQGETAFFLGDTADDLRAARAAIAAGAPLVYAHIADPGDTTRALQLLLDANP